MRVDESSTRNHQKSFVLQGGRENRTQMQGRQLCECEHSGLRRWKALQEQEE